MKLLNNVNKLIDKEIAKIIGQCSERTRNLVESYKSEILKLRDALLEKETLDLTNIIEILGERPFEPKSNYKAYLNSKREIKAETS